MKIKMWTIVDKSINMVMPNDSDPWLDLEQEGDNAPSVPALFKSRMQALSLLSVFGERRDIMTVVPVYVEIKTGDVS